MLKLLAPILLLLTGCSLFIEQLGEQKENFKVLPKLNKTYCQQLSNSHSLVHANPVAIKSFQQTLSKIQKKWILSFIDRAVLWSLFQMRLRPDMSAPTSRLQMVIKYKKQVKYFDFEKVVTAENHSPYLEGLKSILSYYNRPHGLNHLAMLLDQFGPLDYKVGPLLAKSLQANKSQLEEHKLFEQYYLKGDEVLKIGESVPRMSFKQILTQFKVPKRLSKGLYRLTPYEKKRSNGSLITYSRCNFDMQDYERSVFLTRRNALDANTFGIQDQRGNFLLASSIQDLTVVEPLKGTPFFKGRPDDRGASVCLIWDKTNRKKAQVELAMVSTHSRDPGQHLFHFLQYELAKSSSLDQVDKLIKKSRFLFLTNPIRLVFESRRGSEEQLRELYKLQVPLYHATELGKIITHYSSLGHQQAGFILDDRRVGTVSCQK